MKLLVSILTLPRDPDPEDNNNNPTIELQYRHIKQCPLHGTIVISSGTTGRQVTKQTQSMTLVIKRKLNDTRQILQGLGGCIYALQCTLILTLEVVLEFCSWKKS